MPLLYQPYLTATGAGILPRDTNLVSVNQLNSVMFGINKLVLDVVAGNISGNGFYFQPRDGKKKSEHDDSVKSNSGNEIIDNIFILC